ncbi:hypothetical protein M422DRAFT_249318 [Sphaerobolus stellatus SS14]|uniref:Uncharacterized protein n=1 Tax=Sphaerobolus stellatus (strain SS14) TaxID=990650 RepID=A0A0C9W471_SPHS4|nr:hypothetical protein M422DRAFT_249318 [Sphaerobolus stellatus SS14]
MAYQVYSVSGHNKLKELVTTVLFLILPSNTAPYHLEADSLDFTTGAALSQLSDASSIVTTVLHTVSSLKANAQYWGDLSNKAARYSGRALELQLKMAEEKVNNLLQNEAPEEVLL